MKMDKKSSQVVPSAERRRFISRAQALSIAAMAVPFVVSERLLAQKVATFDNAEKAALRDKVKLKIMCMGDSITVGASGVVGDTYRVPLAANLRALGADVAFCGPYIDAPTSEATKHSAVSGILAKQVALSRFASEWTQSSRPDVVLLHLGTNDISFGIPSDEIITYLSDIIDQIRGVVPAVAIFIAKIIGRQDYLNGKVVELNSKIQQLALSKNAGASRLVAVDQYEGFDPLLDTVDGIHPIAHGNAKMAKRWCDAMKENGVVAPAAELFNVLPFKAATLSPGERPTQNLSQALDNSLLTYYERAVSGNASQWIKFDLGMSHAIFFVELIQYSFFDEDAAPNVWQNISSYSVEISVDENSWVKVVEVSGNTAGRTTHALSGPVARYVRITIAKPNKTDLNYVLIRQFRVMGRNA